ncbi:MAG: DUF4276 family protein, partial [Acidobacteria bacterium]|nr:DUF4276 family protein [Acidobacteriota bacterium]
LGENGTDHTWRMHAYKGIGRIPGDLRRTQDPARRLLLDQLPRLLRGYGRSLQHQAACVVVVVDLDDRDCTTFKRDLLGAMAACNPGPRTLFRIAVEESEAWLLGDREAVMTAYPQARKPVLDGYVQDSICGTWELLADAVHAGGSARLKKAGWPTPGRAKCDWAAMIAPHMDVERNLSASFRVFRDGVRHLAAG